MQKKKNKLIRMSDIEAEQVQWLWYPFIPYGKITIIQGDPGEDFFCSGDDCSADNGQTVAGE